MATKLRSKKPRVVVDEIHIKGHPEKFHVHRYWVKRHVSHTKSGKKVIIPGHWNIRRVGRATVRPHRVIRKEIRYNGGFNELADKIAREYHQKHKVPMKKAREIGKKVAADVYREKLARSYGR